MATDKEFMVEFLRWLWAKNAPIPIYKRQDDICNILSKFAEPLGIGKGERFMLVGSTKDETRLEFDHGEGDFDYLIISETRIPVSALEFSSELRCFVHIRGENLRDTLPCTLIDEKYIPTNMIYELRPPAFYQTSAVYHLITAKTSITKTEATNINATINSGKSLETLYGFECPYLDTIEDYTPPDENQMAKRFFQNIFNDSQFLENFAEISKTFGLVCMLNAVIQKNKEKKCPINNSADLPGSEFMLQGIQLTTMGVLRFGQNTQIKKIREDTQKDSPLCNQNLYDKEKHTPRNEKHKNENRPDEIVCASYLRKMSEDLVAAFQIEGSLPDMNYWATRPNRKWPDQYTVQEVRRCDIFLVCKPEVSGNPNPDIDFCLGFTKAELKLTQHMTRGQKQCILIIKTLTYGVLEPYSKILTSFHWKNAVFWLSEMNGIEAFNEHDPIPVLDMVLCFMEQCLHKKFLEHYFIKSNLISGREFTDEIIRTLIKEIGQIRESPIQALRNCYTQEEQLKGKRKQMKLIRQNIEDLKRSMRDPVEYVDRKIEYLKHLLTDERPYHLTEGQPSYSEKFKLGLQRFSEAWLYLLLQEQKNASPLTETSGNVTQDEVRKVLDLANQIMNSRPENRPRIEKALEGALSEALGLVITENDK